MIRSLTEQERFRRGLSLTHFGREVCLSEIRKKNPQATPQEIKILFFQRLYGGLFSSQERRNIIESLNR